MEAEYSASLKGHLLMAMPGLSDPNFAQTVTCICEHTGQGAMGIVINRLHDGVFAGDIFEELSIACTAGGRADVVHAGGPVHAGELFVLHGMPLDWEATLRVTPSIGVSNTRDILEAIAGGRGPNAYLISLGCAGWGPGQLEAEIRENAWLTQPADEDLLFRLPVEMRWGEALKRMGVDPLWLSDTAGHA
jgi:putative transcriptional regulator